MIEYLFSNSQNIVYSTEHIEHIVTIFVFVTYAHVTPRGRVCGYIKDILPSPTRKKQNKKRAYIILAHSLNDRHEISYFPLKIDALYMLWGAQIFKGTVVCLFN